MTIISLLTDFGYRDPFVGVMKGVILRINPDVKIVDLAHDVPPFNIKQAAFALFNSYTYFPSGTIHVVVVDPGVGSDRLPLAVQTEGQTFITPDNGLVSYIIQKNQEFSARKIENSDILLPRTSFTFHGRDIFAPAAAHLSKGLSFHDIGSIVDHPIQLPSLDPLVSDTSIIGRVIYVDHFGNLITNISQTLLEKCGWGITMIEIADFRIKGLSSSYSQCERGEYLGIIGSSGFLEIARNNDRAESTPYLTMDTPVQVFMAPRK